MMASKEINLEEVERAQTNEDMLDNKVLNQDAKEATAAEHDLNLWQAIKTYRKAVFWSIMVSTSIIMEGYDVTLIGSFYGYPSFQKKYGAFHKGSAGYQVSSPWQSALSDMGSVGNIVGALGNGYFTHRYGHRRVMLVNLVALAAFIFITFFAPNIEVLLVGEFLCSIPWGVFATMGPAYAAEVCPLVLRGYLAAYVNLCWAIGQLLSAGVLKGLVNNTTEWSYRVPFAVQWVWPLPLFIVLFFCPESPWWCVRTNQLDKAERSLKRLSQKSDNVDYKQTVALMVHTTRLEEEMEMGSSYLDCFRGTNLIRTEIACGTFLSQITDGGQLAYSPTYFFEQAGISANTAYGIGLGGTGVAFVGTIISWFWMSKFGRRPIFLTGFTILVICLYLVGILACIPQSNGVKYVQATLCVVWLGAYSMTVGPIVYTIVSEVGATRVRTKTVVLGRSVYYLGNIVAQVLEPYMINPTQWNLKGKAGFFWGTASLITTIWAYYRLPETKDRTFEELDIMFARKVRARDFKKYVMDDSLNVGIEQEKVG